MIVAPTFPHPLLVADIGGTNARFALAASPGDAPVLVARIRTAACATPEQAIAEAISHARAATGGARPRSAILCVAGPVLNRAARLTNAPWSFDGTAIASSCGLEQGLLLNDFEAAALALGIMTPSQALPIGPLLPQGPGPRVVLGPGTGLGVAATIVADGRIIALPGEAGHIGFGPQDAQDEGFWPRIERVHGRITPETLLCGPGLARLHRALAPDFGRAPEEVEAEPPVIAARAIAGACPHCRRSADIFLKLLARFSGDMGLVYGATGGVYLRGGVMNSLATLVDDAAFRAAFDDKAPVEALARRIPLARIPDDSVILLAMAILGADPGRFALAYGERLWR